MRIAKCQHNYIGSPQITGIAENWYFRDKERK